MMNHLASNVASPPNGHPAHDRAEAVFLFAGFVLLGFIIGLAL